jgi:pilus assembly protein Flp/PilA
MAGINTSSFWGETSMSNLILKLSAKIENVMSSEEGQDVIEYALVIAFVAFAATAGMTSLATQVNAAFTTIGGDLAAAI